MVREKNHWEERIRELGGADFRKLFPTAKLFDSQGVELPGSGGYKYFGAAKDLPGVRDLFQNEVPLPPKQQKSDLYRNITYDYYGFIQNEDLEMKREEEELENEYQEEALIDWKEKNRELLVKFFKTENLDIIPKEEIVKLIDYDAVDYQTSKHKNNVEPFYKSYENIEKAAQSNLQELQKRKEELLKKYVDVEENEIGFGINKEKIVDEDEDKHLKDVIMMNYEN